MKTKITSPLLRFILICLAFFPTATYAATAVLMTVTNLIQTSPNTFEYDMFITNTGTTDLKLRGYSWGLNLTPGIESGGVLTHSFINRDTAFANLNAVIPGYTASTYHLRANCLNAAAGLEVTLSPGIAYKLARMSVHTTATCWFPFVNPFTPTLPLAAIQVTTQAGKTECKLNAIVTPPGTDYQIAGIASSPITGTLTALTASMIPDPLGPTPFLLNCTCTIYDTAIVKTCDSYLWPLNGLTYTASGTYTNTVTTAGACDSITLLNLTITPLNVTTFNGVTISATASGVAYQWISCGNNMPIVGATNQSFTPLSGGNYAVIVSNGTCTDTSACVTVASVGIHDISIFDKIHLYPNPTQGIVTIQLNEASHLVINNLVGECITDQLMPIGEHRIDMTTVAKGIYLVKIISTKEYYTMKLIKE